MAGGTKILVIDDDRSVCATCRRILTAEGHEVSHELSGQDGVRRAIEGDFDVVLLDLKMPDLFGIDALEAIKRDRPDVSVIIITGYATIQTSVEAIKKGAFHYVPKPFTPEELSIAVSKALADRRVRNENEFLRQELGRLKHTTRLLGRAKATEDLKRQILKVAPSSFTVMIYGESGTGKELVAQAIHEHSPRFDRPFVAVDISALAPTLVESELFGHVRGAFTGATQNRHGHLVAANGGTVFLDEIANMSPEVQGKLLRVLENRRVRPVGSEHEQAIDVRVVAATNKDLYEMVEAGTFREDLYYRLNVIPITVPPLRERADDVPLLATHFLKTALVGAASGTGGAPCVKGFTTAAMSKLIAFSWPGNVRQLRNVVNRLVATVESDYIGVEHLPAEIAGAARARASEKAAPLPRTAEELKEAKKREKELVYRALEVRFVLSALKQCEGNVTRAAELVGMQRPNFHALMRKYGIRAKRGG